MICRTLFFIFNCKINTFPDYNIGLKVEKIDPLTLKKIKTAYLNEE